MGKMLKSETYKGFLIKFKEESQDKVIGVTEYVLKKPKVVFGFVLRKGKHIFWQIGKTKDEAFNRIKKAIDKQEIFDVRKKR